MDPSPAPQSPSAEALFAEFLDRLEAGEAADFEALCAQHPARASALRKVHVRWQAMSEAFTHLSHDANGAAANATSKSVDDLKGRIATPGGRLARYALRDEIARGAMGRIVSAWDEELRREVALKIHRGAVDDARMQRRFLEEAQIAAQLDHPGIVSVHELGVDGDGRPFFAMQLVRGRDLGEILAAVRNGDPEWSRTRVLSVLLRVCEAMAFAHDKGVVHRDLKPGNVMVGRFGETYVMDWGLAHVQGRADASADGGAVDTLRHAIAADEGDSPLLTRVGDVIGTPAYMAPEQAAGLHSASPAVDIWSLGAILYHLLAGAMPYAAHARSADAVLTALRAGPPAPLPHDVPPELRAIQERAMARDPAARYASMLELADDLRAFLEVRTVRAYATGRFAELRKWVARNRTLTALASMLVLALVIGGIAVTTLWIRADEDRDRADASAGRLQVALDRSTFQRARQALQLDNSTQAAMALWRAHCEGRMPRATRQALKELAARDPYLVAVPQHEDDRPLAWSARGDALLVGGADGRLVLRDPGTLAIVATIGDTGPRLTALAAIDDQFAVAGNSRGELLRFDLTARQVVQRTPAHRGAVTAIATLPTGGYVTSGAGGKVLAWTTGEAEPKLLLTHGAKVNALAVRPPGDAIVAAGDDGMLAGASFDGSWQLRPRRLGSSLAAVAFGSSPDRVWVGDDDQRVRMFDLRETKTQWVHWTRNGSCTSLAPLPEGASLTGGWWRVDRWAADGTTHTPVALRPISRMALAPDRRWLATSSKQSGLGIVDLAPTDRRTIARAGAAGLSGDGRVAAVSITDHAIVYDVATGAVTHDLPKDSNGWLALDDDGSHLASNKRDPGGISIYEVATHRLVFTSTGPNTGSGFAIRFSPDGNELAFSDQDKIRRVRTHDGSPVAEYVAPKSHVNALAWSADGRWLAAAIGTAVRVYEVATGNYHDQSFERDWQANAPRSINAIALDSTGSTLAAGNGSGLIRVRRADGSTQALAGHDGTVWSLQFAAADPGLLYSSGGAQGLACWDLDSGECCYQTGGDQVSQLNVSRDGQTLCGITPSGALLLDLSYHDRHIAGNLAMRLDEQREAGALSPARERELRDWADLVLARPWPRWR